MRDGIYRICAASDWAQTTQAGQLPLSQLDERDGFVHLSTAKQVPDTLRRFFDGREDLLLLSIGVDRLIDGELRYESASPGSGPESGPDSGGELFPHFYGRIGLAAVFEAVPLALDEHGQHRLPASLLQAIAEARDPH